MNPFDIGGKQLSGDDRSLLEMAYALEAAKASVGGNIPLNTGPNQWGGNIQEWGGIPRLDPTVFGRMAPADRELYMNGIRRLPEPYLNKFFELPNNTKWTSEMIDQRLTPWMDVHKTGTPFRGI